MKTKNQAPPPPASDPSRLQRALTRYIHFITGHPYVVILLTLLVTALLATQLQHLHIDYDPDDAVPAGHPLILSGDRINAAFGGGFMTAIALEVTDGDIFRPEILEKIQRITAALRLLPGVRPNRIFSLASANVKDIQGTPDGMRVQPLMETVPRTAAGLDALRARVRRNPLYTGLLISRDAKMATILSDYQSMKAAGGASALYARWERITRDETDARCRFHISGIPVLLHWMDVYSARMAWVFPLAILVIGLLHFHAFRTLQGVFIPLLTAGLSVTWAMGLLGLARLNLDPYNLMTPILVLAVAAGHSVQILKRYYEDYHRLGDSRAAVVEATSRVGIAMLAAGVVASAGMASLVTFRSPSIRHFGLLSALGILSALILELNFIPALRTVLPPPSARQAVKERERTVFDIFLSGLIRWLSAGRTTWVIAGAAVFSLLALAGASLVKVDNSLSAYFPATSRVTRDLAAINGRLGGAFVLQIMLDAGIEDGVKNPRLLADMEALQAYLDTQPGVGKTQSVVDFLKQMNRVMHNDDPRFDVLPASRELTSQYLLLYSMSGDPGDLEQVVDFPYQRGVISAYVRSDGYDAGRRLLSGIRQFIRDRWGGRDWRVQFGGGITGGMAISESVIHGKIYNILQVAVIIFLVSALVFRSALAGALVLMPLLLTVVVNLAVMGVSGISLNAATASISAVAMGMGADYGIYYLFRFREELARTGDWRRAFAAAESTSGKAILYVATAISLGYACTVLSGFSIHIYMGVLVPLTMALSSLSSLTLLPSLLLKLRPKFMRAPGAADTR